MVTITERCFQKILPLLPQAIVYIIHLGIVPFRYQIPALRLTAWQSMESDPSISGIRELLFPDKDMGKRMLKSGERIGERDKTNRTDLSLVSHKVLIPREIGIQLSKRPY